METKEQFSEIEEKKTPDLIKSTLKYDVDFVSLFISVNEEEETINYKLKNIIEPIYWENSFTYEDLKQ